MIQAAVSGLDISRAWELTPGELDDTVEAFRRRMEIQSYWGYNLAVAIAAMVRGGDRPEPWAVFPRWIQREQMSDNDIYANCLAWCGGAVCKQDD